MHGAFRSAQSLINGTAIQPVAAFRDLLDLAVDLRVDLVALTGDIVNFPQRRTVDWVSSTLNSSLKRAGMDIPYIYCSGNHDWFYEGSASSQQELQRRWRRTALHPLYAESLDRKPFGGVDAACNDGADFAAVEIQGLNLVTIDNSLQQITEAQLRFFRAQILRWLPTVLLLHVPMSVTEDVRPFMGYALCGDPAWGADSDRSWKDERRQQWPKSGSSESTRLFLEAVQSAAAPMGPLILVLSGHIHHHNASPFAPGAKSGSTERSAWGAVQYIGLPAFRGGYRYVEIKTLPQGRPEPLSDADVEEISKRRRASEDLLSGLSHSIAGAARGSSCWDSPERPDSTGVIDTTWVLAAAELMLKRNEASMRQGFSALASAFKPLLEASCEQVCKSSVMSYLGSALALWADPQELRYVQGRILNFGPGRDVFPSINKAISALKREGSWEDFGVHVGEMVVISAVRFSAS
eukprot:gnl/MRDRNA2_/MRDRNA2_80662_c1_seq1.p1 gnl/MRDRNA2_/MRDRNA2_80662_c1~~gnl/MRDRNA2_/MRDRNA2_80662_c1_seq1.p1  ORF type:complete len:544 (+),score=103.71 gnl/MRDRNA2_/MRDRNA2_80662_c1_seq1:240-1634(+)